MTTTTKAIEMCQRAQAEAATVDPRRWVLCLQGDFAPFRMTGDFLGIGGKHIYQAADHLCALFNANGLNKKATKVGKKVIVLSAKEWKAKRIAELDDLINILTK